MNYAKEAIKELIRTKEESILRAQNEMISMNKKISDILFTEQMQVTELRQLLEAICCKYDDAKQEIK